ncbi:MAG: hypothetical protein VYD54_08935 [Bdellovibrionota bacterium]|nr:hypothetical protein [Bdellovibrionota bacterium]
MKLHKIIFIFSLLLKINFSYSSELSESEIKRLRFIENSFRQGDKWANYWQWGFWGMYTAGAVVRGALYFSLKGEENISEEDRIKRFDYGVDAVKATIGSIGLWFRPLVADRAYKEITSLPDGKAKLKRAEELLTKAEKRVKGEMSWIRRTSALVINGLAYLAIAKGDNRPKDGLKNFALGMIVSEIQIRTVPERPIRDAATYRKRFQIKESSIWDNLQIFPGVNRIHLTYSF